MACGIPAVAYHTQNPNECVFGGNIEGLAHIDEKSEKRGAEIWEEVIHPAAELFA